jgi:hypothetical protein
VRRRVLAGAGQQRSRRSVGEGIHGRSYNHRRRFGKERFPVVRARGGRAAWVPQDAVTVAARRDFPVGRQSRLNRLGFQPIAEANNNKYLDAGEGSTTGPFPPPLAPAKAFSRSGCRRIFPLFSRVMREELSTVPAARRHGSGLSGSIFSGAVNCFPSGAQHQHSETHPFFQAAPARELCFPFALRAHLKSKCLATSSAVHSTGSLF